MSLDLRNIGQKLGQMAADAVKGTDSQPSSPAAAPVTGSTPQPQGRPAAPDTNTAYGSANLRFAAGKPLSMATAQVSTSMVMGSDEQNGSTGFLFDLSRYPAHAMTLGPSRKGGKGTSAIIPALLTYSAGSTLNLDPKAENYFTTAPALREQGKRVVKMDPWDEANRRYGSMVGISEPSTRFNPLSALDPKSPDFADDVAALADALIVVPDSVNRHFDESARELVAGAIALAVERNPGRASLRDVRDMLTMDDEELAKMIAEAVKANPRSVAARKLRRFTKQNNEVANVRATAETQTAFLDSETLLDSMETDDPPFNLDELATGRVALFLVLPVDRLETHGRWMRMIITLAIRAIARQAQPPKHPVLFLLDEMGTIGRLAMVEQAYGLMAGLGIRLWGFFQDLVQLQGLYPKTWETFFSNSSVIQILKAHDPTTSEYVSRYMGNGTVNAKTGSWSLKTRRYSHPDEYENMLRQRVVGILVKDGRNEAKAREAINALRDGNAEFTKSLDDLSRQRLLGALDTAQKGLKILGYDEMGVTEWTEDEQLISRPLMDPDEIRRLDDSRCLLLVPGRDPVALYRTVYYKHPLFAGLYRPNPYFSTAAAAAPLNLGRNPFGLFDGTPDEIVAKAKEGGRS